MVLARNSTKCGNKGNISVSMQLCISSSTLISSSVSPEALEGSHQLCEHALLLEHLPLILVQKLLLFMSTAVEDDHGPGGNAMLLLVQLVLHEGADGSLSVEQKEVEAEQMLCSLIFVLSTLFCVKLSHTTLYDIILYYCRLCYITCRL